MDHASVSGVRAMRLHQPGPLSADRLRADEVPEPVAGPGQLVVKVGACAVCRTDLQIASGDLAARRLPITLGHQAVGRIVELGTDTEGWRIGDRVGAYWLARHLRALPLLQVRAGESVHRGRVHRMGSRRRVRRVHGDRGTGRRAGPTRNG